jgi:hypothetical protein
MTTFHEGDLFTETFEGFGDVQDARRRRMWPSVVALVVAAVLLVGGLAWLREGPRQGVEHAVDATTLLSVFNRPQTVADRPSGDDLDGVTPTVDPETTRFLLTDADGAEYAAVSNGGRLCIVTVPRGDLASATCVKSLPHSTITVSDDLVVSTTGTDPKLGAGWTQVQPNVWTRG